MQNPYFLPQLGSYQKPPTDPQSLGVNIGRPFIPNIQQSGIPQQAGQMGGGIGLNSVLGGLTGGLDIYNSAHNMANQSLGLNPQIGQQDGSYYGLGQDYNQAALAKPQGATGGEVLGMGAKGAAAGAAFGPVGAGIGFVAGAAAGLIGGRRRKKKQQAEKTSAQQKLKAGQQSYNQAAEYNTQQQNAAEDYLDRQNTTSRMNNLYATR